MNYDFTIIIERQPEGEYFVTVPILPGCITEGDTLEEARALAADAISACCASLKSRREAGLTRDEFTELLKK